jgi:hypothetical protein
MIKSLSAGFLLLSIYDSNESIDFVQGNTILSIEVLDELEVFIDKKVIFYENKFVRLSALCSL